MTDTDTPVGAPGLSLHVGVGVLVRDGAGDVLLGLRRGSHGATTWGLPGGHLEPGETIAACAARETLEETGLAIEGVRHVGFSADVFEDVARHYVTLFVEAGGFTGELELLEPRRCERWEWFAWNALPAPLFAPLASLVRQRVVAHGPVG